MTQLAVEGVIPPWTLPDRLRKAREFRELTQAQLAEITGLSARSVFNYENGHTTPKRPQLIAWAMATGVALDWLVEDAAVRPKGLEPLTFWTVLWEHDPDDGQGHRQPCSRCGRGLWDDEGELCEDCVRTDDLALAA